MVAAANAASTRPNQGTGQAGGAARTAEGSRPNGDRASGIRSAGIGRSSIGPPHQAGDEDGPPPVSDSERAFCRTCGSAGRSWTPRRRRSKTRESVLAATEQKLAARLTELQALQKKLEGLDAAQKQKEEAGWQGLVKLYEDMKPKDAATIFNDLSMPVLLQLMDRMKDAKAALVMAAMNPDKARDVTAELAQMRTGRDASGAPVAGLKPNLTGG